MERRDEQGLVSEDTSAQSELLSPILFCCLKSECGKATPENVLVESSLSRHAKEHPGSASSAK